MMGTRVVVKVDVISPVSETERGRWQSRRGQSIRIGAIATVVAALNALKTRGISISMDGLGRALDSVFIEDRTCRAT